MEILSFKSIVHFIDLFIILIQEIYTLCRSSSTSPRSSPSLQRKGSDVDIKFSNVGQALMSSTVLSSSLVIPNPKQTLSVSTNASPSSPTVSSREPSIEMNFSHDVNCSINGTSKECSCLDNDTLGSLPINVSMRTNIFWLDNELTETMCFRRTNQITDKCDGNGSQDNVSRSSESGRSLDGSSYTAPISTESSRLDPDKLGGSGTFGGISASGGRSSSGETKGTVSSTGKTSEKKKKSTAWYNVLNPTYKSRSDDFKKIFKDLPESERLIVDYSCAMQKDLIVHGRLYLSQNYICFYANIFRWETIVVLKCKDVASMTKERTARVIPNAIQICSETEKYFFTSFAARDKTYLMLFRVWQNALLEQPMTIQELWQWVHYSYGEELGLTSDDDDYIAPLEEKVEMSIDQCRLLASDEHKMDNSNDHHHIIDGRDDEDEIDSYKQDDDFSRFNESDSRRVDRHLLADAATPSQQSFPHFSSTLNTSSPRHNKIAIDSDKKLSNDVPTDMSDTSETNEIPEGKVCAVNGNLGNGVDAEFVPSEIPCPCSSHEGKEIINEVISFSVDQMFSLLFGGSNFLKNLYESRKIFDIVQSDWKTSDQPHKIRQLTYTVSVNNPMSPKIAPTTETQTLLEHKANQLCIVRSDVVTTGIPYGDSFSCFTNYCITRVNSGKCRMKVSAGIIFRKSVFGLVKGFIEKNAIANIIDYFNDLCVCLHREAGIQGGEMPKIKKSRRRRRIKIGSTTVGAGASSTGGSAVTIDGKMLPNGTDKEHLHKNIRKTGSPNLLSSHVDGNISSIFNMSESFIKMLFAIRCSLFYRLMVVLVLNISLFYKLWLLEEQTAVIASISTAAYQQTLPPLHLLHNKKIPETNEEWIKLLHSQQMLNNIERQKWKSLVSDIIKLIQTTEVSLSQLFENIQNSQLHHHFPQVVKPPATNPSSCDDNGTPDVNNIQSSHKHDDHKKQPVLT
ncbi:GRAM domain-containing protein 1B [Nymphon striatum]|nr:GRAM domain-containing protein 1B [Nymphon striatum]